MTTPHSTLPKSAAAAMHPSMPVRQNLQTFRSVPTMPSPKIHPSAGAIVGRRDLSDEVVLQAIAERLAFERRDPRQARTVLNAALAGKQIAVNFVRSLALPLPTAPLEMPVQALFDAAPRGEAGAKRRFFTFGW